MTATNNLDRIYKKFFTRVFPDLAAFLSQDLIESNTVLDMGCGNRPSPVFSVFMRLPYRGFFVGADIFRPYLLNTQPVKSYETYVLCDVLANPFLEKSVDVVVLGSIIEHLSKDDGLRLISLCERIAMKRIIAVVPNGFCPQDMYDGNVHQKHLSYWDGKMMNSLGFHVMGVNGL